MFYDGDDNDDINVDDDDNDDFHRPSVEEIMQVLNSPDLGVHMRNVLGEGTVDQAMRQKADWADSVNNVLESRQYVRILGNLDKVETTGASEIPVGEGYACFNSDAKEGEACPSTHTLHQTLSPDMSMCYRVFLAKYVDFEQYEGKSDSRGVRLLGRDDSCEDVGNEAYILYGPHDKPNVGDESHAQS